MIMSRRNIMLMTSALTMSVLLTGCETVTTGSVTTHSLNVKKIKTYAQAGLNAANTVVSILSLYPGLVTFIAPVKLATTVLNNAINAFSQIVGDKIEISYDDTNYKTVVNSLLDELTDLLGAINLAVEYALKNDSGLDVSVLSKIALTRDALSTLISVFNILVGGFITTASGTESHMTEKQALRVLNVS